VLADIDINSLAANEVNEDRAGIAGAMAWVIDGATDLIDTPLTTGRLMRAGSPRRSIPC